MASKLRSRFRFFRMNLRTKVALGVALPILLVLILLSLVHYRHNYQLVEDQIALTAMQLGEVMRGSLRLAMLSNDREMLAQTLFEIGAMKNVQQVQIIGPDGRVKVASSREKVGALWQADAPGCRECHQFPAESRPRTTHFTTVAGLLRISTPIANEPDCAGCHSQKSRYLGVLLADVSVIDIEKHLLYNLQVDLAISLGLTLLVTLGAYLLIHWLVVRRVEFFRPALAEFAAANFAFRLPSASAPTDELDELAGAFNRMADELDRRGREEKEQSKLRQQAIAEERGRIARELHDGLAQVLGYVNTKAMAVRLMLQNHQIEVANQTLLQLEEAARELFVDVREAILDLRIMGQEEASLAATLKEFTAQFSRLSNLPVELTLAPAVENLTLLPETKLQLLRIAQESLTNIRKHASASRACVSLQANGNMLELTIGDDGGGFELDRIQTIGPPHFGLGTMRERAEAIQAELKLESGPGSGTRVIVRLPFKKEF